MQSHFNSSHTIRDPISATWRDAMTHVSSRFVVLFIGSLTAILLCAGWAWPSWCMVDDAYFYLCVGRNLADGLGSTFGDVTSTNGYHPLWQWCVAGIYLIVGDNDLLALRAGMMANVVMVAGSLIMVWVFACRLAPPRLAAASPLLFAFTATQNSHMLETWLYVTLVQVLLLWTAGVENTPRLRAWFTHVGLGILAGAIILARLDSALLIAAWFAFVGWRRIRYLGLAAAIRGGMLEGVSVAAIVLPYVVGNYICFGHFATISSMLKTSFPRPTTMGISSVRFLVLTIPGVLTGVLYLIRPGLWSRLQRAPATVAGRSGASLGLRVLVVGTLLRTSAVYLFSNYRPWLASYWVDAVLVASLLLPSLLVGAPRSSCRLAQERHAKRETGVVVFLYVLPVLWHLFNISCAARVAQTQLDAKRALGQWYAQMVPSDAVVFQRDYIGIPTFWSRRRVLDGGGLMNNIEFQEAVTAGRLVSYLQEHGVSYVMADELEWLEDAPALLAGEYESATYPIRSALTHATASLQLRGEWEIGRYRHEVPRKWPFGDSTVVQTFCLWKLPDNWTECCVK